MACGFEAVYMSMGLALEVVETTSAKSITISFMCFDIMQDMIIQDREEKHFFLFRVNSLTFFTFHFTPFCCIQSQVPTRSLCSLLDCPEMVLLADLKCIKKIRKWMSATSNFYLTISVQGPSLYVRICHL